LSSRKIQVQKKKLEEKTYFSVIDPIYSKFGIEMEEIKCLNR